jgi:hypothetical protein
MGAPMMWPTFEVALFREGADGKVAEDERQRSQSALLWMLEALCKVDQGELEFHRKRKGKYPPPLYASGIRYQRENGTENWQDVYRNFELMSGDCEDLACHRVAELRCVYGRQAAPFVKYRRGDDGAFHYHALVAVKGPDGWRLEDPSFKLGMGWEDMFDGIGPGSPEALQLERRLDLVQKEASPKLLSRLVKVVV